MYTVCTTHSHDIMYLRYTHGQLIIGHTIFVSAVLIICLIICLVHTHSVDQSILIWILSENNMG